jgi:hypothetical protein
MEKCHSRVFKTCNFGSCACDFAIHAAKREIEECGQRPPLSTLQLLFSPNSSLAENDCDESLKNFRGDQFGLMAA